MAEDGKVLVSATCSHEDEAKTELGVNEGTAEDCHVVYRKYFPGGYVMEFIPASNLDDHKGLHKALKANQERGANA
jgi:hypothetical protein